MSSWVLCVRAGIADLLVIKHVWQEHTLFRRLAHPAEAMRPTVLHTCDCSAHLQHHHMLRVSYLVYKTGLIGHACSKSFNTPSYPACPATSMHPSYEKGLVSSGFYV